MFLSTVQDVLSLNRLYVFYLLKLNDVIRIMRNISAQPSPDDSNRDAVLMVSPNKQYLGIFLPTTPAAHGPTWIIVASCYLVSVFNLTPTPNYGRSYRIFNNTVNPKI